MHSCYLSNRENKDFFIINSWKYPCSKFLTAPYFFYMYILPLPLNQARNTTSFNQTILTLANSTKMTHNTIPQVDSSAHQIPFIYISLSTPHINTQHVTNYASSPRRFMRTWILAHNPIVFSISNFYKDNHRTGMSTVLQLHVAVAKSTTAVSTTAVASYML